MGKRAAGGAAQWTGEGSARANTRWKRTLDTLFWYNPTDALDFTSSRRLRGRDDRRHDLEIRVLGGGRVDSLDCDRRPDRRNTVAALLAQGYRWLRVASR